MNAHLSRRELLTRSALGFGALAAADLLAAIAGPQDAAASARTLPVRAKRVIFLFMHGGPSQVDTFDWKPLLHRDDGKPLPFAKPRIQFAQTGNLMRSPWKFTQHGQSGSWASALFPNVAKHVDDLCFVKSLHGTNPAHGGALLSLHTGSDTFVRPSMGSWILYGLGTENRDLPGFITISPTLGHGGVQNWSSAFLPGSFQGSPVGRAGLPTKDARLRHLDDPSRLPDARADDLALLRELNRVAKDPASHDPMLDAQVEAFELAFRMQAQAPDAFDVSKESAETKKLYGIDQPGTDDFGRQCLLARRLSERGVRFVQCSHSYKWDQHEQLKEMHEKNAAEVDLPIAGLLADLKGRGLLKDTLVVWAGEFGRTPTMQGNKGRDHNPHGFTIWMAGGGVKGGFSYGETDDYGFYAVRDKVHVHDFHATLLALLGLDHEKLTWRHAGRDFRLTDVSGRVVTELFAS